MNKQELIASVGDRTGLSKNEATGAVEAVLDGIGAALKQVREAKRIALLGTHEIAFNEKTDLVFYRREALPFHANGMRFTAFDADGTELLNRIYYSVGGGFVVSDEIAQDGSRQKTIAPDTTVLAHPFHSGAELLVLAKQQACSIAELMRRVEAGGVSEVVLATNQTTTGEATAIHIAELLRDKAQVTRLASGLPVGADLEHADEVTLGRALTGRRNV